MADMASRQAVKGTWRLSDMNSRSKNDPLNMIGPYDPGWEVQGRYFSLGPLIEARLSLEEAQSGFVDPGSFLFHEMLHHGQISSSTLGLLDATLVGAIAIVHRNFPNSDRELRIEQPYLSRLRKDADELTYVTLDGVLNLEYIRNLLKGFPTNKNNPNFFQKSIRHASSHFASVYGQIFPEASAELVDLDGRSWDSDDTLAGPLYSLDNWVVGSGMLFEFFATTVQLFRGSKLGERGSGSPWAAEVGGIIPSKYRGPSMLFLDALFRHPDLKATGSSFAETIFVLCELAVNPAVLPCHWSLWRKKPTWKDIQPGYRLYSMLNCLERFGLCPDLG